MDFSQLQATDSRINWGVVKLEILQKLWQQRNITGAGIRVGVLDASDIPDHPDLHIFPKSQKIFSAKLVAHHHGTYCGGTVAAAGAEVFGVAPETTIAYGKVAITAKSVAEGIEWLLTVRPSVQVISISLEIFEENEPVADFQALKAAVDHAEEKGKIVVAAVGNDFSRRREMVTRFPAGFPNVLAVGALKEDLTLHPESGMNSCIDFVAPGHNLLTAEQGGGTFAGFSRTSAAAAFASGAVALVLQALKDREQKMTTAEVAALLRETATFNFANATRCQSNLYGCGIINPVAAVEKSMSNEQ
ncbi:MAG: S8 family serine peptidase [Saprospiraceae bacterium]